MSNLTITELFGHAYQLYQDRKYAQALDLLTRESNRFPEWAQRIFFWRMCMASRMNETAHALQLFEEAIAAGYWYSEAQLREDSDLQPLQGLLEFESLVEVCRKRQAAAQAQATPVLVALQPEDRPQAGHQPWPLLLALHGNNSNARSSVEYWRSAIASDWLLALPQSSQVGGPDAYVWNDREWAAREIQEHYAALCEEYTVDRKRVAVGGFSMGGRLAIWLALSGAIRVRGFIAVGPFLPEDDSWVPIIEVSQGHGLRGYIIVGEQDTTCYEGSQALAALLRSQDIPCELEVHPDLGHDYPPDFQESLSRALAFILQA